MSSNYSPPANDTGFRLRQNFIEPLAFTARTCSPGRENRKAPCFKATFLIGGGDGGDVGGWNK